MTGRHNQLTIGRAQRPRAARSTTPTTVPSALAKEQGRSRARTIKSAGVSVRAAAGVIASPIATLRPVLENSLNRVVPIGDSPTITVPAAWSKASTTTVPVSSASRGQGCRRPNDRQTPEHKGRNRSRTRKEESDRERFDERRNVHRARVIQARTLRVITRLIAIVASGRRASQTERYTANKSPSNKRTVTDRGTSRSGRWSRSRVRSRRHPPSHFLAQPLGKLEPVCPCLHDCDQPTAPRASPGQQAVDSGTATSATVPSSLFNRRAISGGEPGPSTRSTAFGRSLSPIRSARRAAYSRSTGVSPLER